MFLDINTPAFFTGYVNYYVDDIEEFQRVWFQLEGDEDRKKRFLKCKNGNYECDLPFLTEDEELRMIQKDENYKCLHKESVEYHDIEVDILNGSFFPSHMYIKYVRIDYCFIEFKNKIQKIAKFEIKGICQDDLFEKGNYNKVFCEGNRVIKIENNENIKFSADKRDVYDEVVVKSIAYKELLIIEHEEGEKWIIPEELLRFEECRDVDLQILLLDLVGETG